MQPLIQTFTISFIFSHAALIVFHLTFLCKHRSNLNPKCANQQDKRCNTFLSLGSRLAVLSSKQRCVELLCIMLLCFHMLIALWKQAFLPMETLQIMQSTLSKQLPHHYVKTYISMFREELASAVRCPY